MCLFLTVLFKVKLWCNFWTIEAPDIMPAYCKDKCKGFHMFGEREYEAESWLQNKYLRSGNKILLRASFYKQKQNGFQLVIYSTERSKEKLKCVTFRNWGKIQLAYQGEKSHQGLLDRARLRPLKGAAFDLKHGVSFINCWPWKHILAHFLLKKVH